MSAAKKTGRPRKEEPPREVLSTVTFKADAEVREALEIIAPPEGQSTAIRKLILDEAARRRSAGNKKQR